MDDQTSHGYTRREMLKMTAFAGGGLILGASGIGAAMNMVDAEQPKPKKSVVYPFFGQHQAGIVTPHQSYGYLAALDLDPTIADVTRIMALFISWTRLAATLTEGKRIANSSNKELPPNDTNETRELGAAGLTITFGLGYSFFIKKGKDRFGLASSMPKQLTEMPKLPHETINPAKSNGDLCIQVCADQQQVAFHAMRNLIKEAIGSAHVRWLEKGFINRPDGKTPRNLFGFKDGTANVSDKDVSGQKRVIWTGKDEPRWMQNGTYLGYRKIKMNIETWDRDSFRDQEEVFGRKKDSGAPFGQNQERDPLIMSKQPADAHVALAHRTGKEIYRRPFSYTDGINEATGHLDAGLLFISFQNKPQDSFIPMLRVLGQSDALNEYTDHIATGLFAVPGGIGKNEYLAQHLFE